MDDHWHGLGKLVLPNGDQYEGEFLHGSFHGHGVLRYARRDVYEGNWVAGAQHGFGRMVHSDGSVYSGDWQVCLNTPHPLPFPSLPEHVPFLSAVAELRSSRWGVGYVG